MSTTALTRTKPASRAEGQEKEKGGRTFFVVTGVALVLMGISAVASLAIVVYVHLIGGGVVP